MPFVNANGVRTFYRSVGEGPPLLLIAGNGMEHTTFDEQLPVFSPRFRCIVYDMRGIGASDTPEDGYTTREMAVDAFSLLDALDIFPGRPHRILNFQAKDFTDRALAFLLAHR